MATSPIFSIVTLSFIGDTYVQPLNHASLGNKEVVFICICGHRGIKRDILKPNFSQKTKGKSSNKLINGKPTKQ